jgi:tetratricopeptide (TPR) repeat protein
MLQGQLNESKEEQYKNSVALELCRSLSGLGSVYLAERNFASSETSFRRALKLAGERWKASSTKWQQNDWAEILATTLGRLGDLFRDWNKLPEADRYYKLALKIVTATPTSKYLMPDIASREIQLLHQMGRDDEVKALEQSSAGAKSGNSQSNREDEKVADQIEAELSKGRNYLDAKDYPQALQCFLQAKDMAKALRPKHLPACLLLIGRVYSDQGKYEEAIDSLSQAMAYEQARNGPTSWLVSAMAIEMGECYQKWGKNEKAEIYFEKSAHIEEMSPREAASNWRLQIALAKLATLFKTEGKVPQARQTEARLEKALNRPFILVDSRPDSVKEQLKCWLNKCDIYKSQNRLSKVDLVREQTIQLAEKYLGTSNQTMIDDFKIQLAAQYAAEGNYGKSAQLYRSVLMTEGLEKCAKSHRDELKTYEGVLRHLGRVAEASELNGRLGR